MLNSKVIFFVLIAFLVLDGMSAKPVPFPGDENASTAIQDEANNSATSDDGSDEKTTTTTSSPDG